jgi:outer membrane murein-binding lipoprotein Lpp
MTDTPTPVSPAPPTSPRGLALGEDPGVRDLVLAFRADWESWKEQRAGEKQTENQRLDAVVSGLATLNGRMEVIEQDVSTLSKDVKSASVNAADAATRAETAHTIATTASVAAGKVSVDHDAERESNLAILAETRGQLKQAIEAINQLRETDVALKQSDEKLVALVQESTKNSIGEVFGKNPKFMAALIGVLIVVAQVLSARYLVPPAAPNQGAFPGATPVVHAETITTTHMIDLDGGSRP